MNRTENIDIDDVNVLSDLVFRDSARAHFLLLMQLLQNHFLFLCLLRGLPVALLSVIVKPVQSLYQ